MKVALTGHLVVTGTQLPDDAVRWVEREHFYLTDAEKVSGVSLVDVERSGVNFNRWLVRRVIVPRA